MKIINIDVIKQTYDVSPVEGDVNVIKVKFINTPSEWLDNGYDEYGVYALFTKDNDSEIMNVDKATMECAVPNRMIAENSGLKVTLYAMNSDTANPRRYVVEPVWIAISEGYEVSATSGLNIDNMDAISSLIQAISKYPVEEQKRVEAENKRAEAEVRREEVVAEYGKDIEALVDGAPDRLNTLKKLASAINNDDHYSDTIMDEINALRSSANGALHNVNEHIEDYQNPHHVTQGDVGLGHVDDTSDLDKPLSKAAQIALAEKLDKSAVRNPESVEGDPLEEVPSVAYMLDYVTEKCKDNIVDLGTYKVEVDPDTGNTIIDESSQFRNAVNEAKQTGVYKITLTEAGAQMPFILVVLGSVDLRGKDLVTQYCFRDNPFLPADYNVPPLPRIRKYYYSDKKNAYVWTDDEYFNSESIFQTTTNLVHDDTNFNEYNELEYPSVGSMVRYIDRKLQPEQPITTLPDILESNKEYIIGGFLDSVFISFPSIANKGDVIYITFYAENVDGLPNLVIDTTNTSDIELIPEPSAGYEIFAKYNGEIWIVDYSEYSLGW